MLIAQCYMRQIVYSGAEVEDTSLRTPRKIRSVHL